LAAIWENWKRPDTHAWMRTFTVLKSSFPIVPPAAAALSPACS
jgi:hypothetical protein